MSPYLCSSVHAGVASGQATGGGGVQIEANVQSGAWGAAANPHDRMVAELAAAAQAGLRATQALHQEHTQYVDQFMERKDDALHLDLRFLAVHANLNSYFQDTHRNR